MTAQPEPEPVEPARAEPKPPEPKPAQKAEAKPPAEAKQERPPMQTSSITPRASVATSIDVARARAGELAGYQRSVAGILSTKKPDAIGETAKVLVWFMIGRNGRVREIELLEPSGNARVDALVLDHYKKLAFPPPPPHLSGTDLAFRIRVAVR